MVKTDEIFEKTHTMGIHEAIAEIKHQEGIEKGLRKGKELSVRLLLTNTKHSPAKIAELVGVSVPFVEKIKKRLSAK